MRLIVALDFGLAECGKPLFWQGKSVKTSSVLSEKEGMKKSSANLLFSVFCLALAAALAHSYSLFTAYFSPERDLVRKVAELESNVEREALKRSLAEARLQDYRFQVAAVLPKNNPGMRAIASVSVEPTKQMDLSGLLLERGKAAFNQKDYSAAIAAFRELVEKYPTSPHVTMSHFFLAESYVLISKPEDALDEIQFMMKHFPEDEKTGFIMLRMGQILEDRERYAEAAEVYRTIQREFASNYALKKQAGESLSKVQ